MGEIYFFFTPFQDEHSQHFIPYLCDRGLCRILIFIWELTNFINFHFLSALIFGGKTLLIWP